MCDVQLAKENIFTFPIKHWYYFNVMIWTGVWISHEGGKHSKFDWFWRFFMIISFEWMGNGQKNGWANSICILYSQMDIFQFNRHIILYHIHCKWLEYRLTSAF